jgi:gamma-glutamyl-gamma-aminobutyrate hydrolase PuuD
MVPCVALPHWRAPTFERTQHYYESLRKAGGEPLVVDGPELPAETAGLVLTGGVDVDPHLYGERRGPRTERPNKPRDAHEMRLLQQALERDLPVLAVCRGHQFLNVALGGSLAQHIEGDGHRADDAGESRWHTVSLVDGGGRLGEVYGARRDLRVNSRHHQAVTAERLAPSLAPLAYSPDGLVEAVESRAQRWVVGVQWHPERPEMHPAADALFAAFVAVCRG